MISNGFQRSFTTQHDAPDQLRFGSGVTWDPKKQESLTHGRFITLGTIKRTKFRTEFGSISAVFPNNSGSSILTLCLQTGNPSEFSSAGSAVGNVPAVAIR